MVSDHDVNPASLIAQHKFESVDVTDGDSLETTFAALAIPFPDQNSFAFSSFDLDIASEPFAMLDEQSCWDVSGDGYREVVHVSNACCEDSVLQSPILLIAD